VILRLAGKFVDAAYHRGGEEGWEMKKLVVLLLIVLGLTAIGWLTFNMNDRNPSVEIDTDKVRSDTESILDEGKDLLRDTGEAIRESAEETTE
jgi:hypothetical protein